MPNSQAKRRSGSSSRGVGVVKLDVRTVAMQHSLGHVRLHGIVAGMNPSRKRAARTRVLNTTTPISSHRGPPRLTLAISRDGKYSVAPALRRTRRKM